MSEKGISYKGLAKTYEYENIIKNEVKLKTAKYIESVININALYILQERERDIRNTTVRLLEIAKNSTVLRCGLVLGNVTTDKIAYESDGAHTNLMRALVKYALDFVYGWGNNSPSYHREEIDEAALIHDLPENVIGDIPDNRARNEAQKIMLENAYFDEFITRHTPRKSYRAYRVKSLLEEMQNKSTPEGRILYAADKLSAIITMLALDSLELYPHAFPGGAAICNRSEEELSFCTKRPDGSILLSDAWTIDFLYGRELNQYDDYSFFTAILVMATLLVRGEWYKWRYDQYI